MPTKKVSKKKAVSKKTRARRTTRARKTATRNTARKTVVAKPATPNRELSAYREVTGPAPPLPSLHCTLAPMQAEALLLPTNVIAEVVEFIEPVPVNSAPQWFLGQIEWENRQVPVFSYAALISGEPPADITGKARIMIIKSLSDSARMPYLGILISDIPSLLTVRVDELVNTGDEKMSLGVYCHVDIQNQAAIIPDLDRLTHLVTHAAFGILPITQTQ